MRGPSVPNIEVAAMKVYGTRVSIWFYSEGASPAKVIEKLVGLGFTPVRGAYDFVYKHEPREAMTESDLSSAIVEISNALHVALAGFKVLYTLDTHPLEEDDLIPLEDIDAELEATRAELKAIESETESKE